MPNADLGELASLASLPGRVSAARRSPACSPQGFADAPRITSRLELGRFVEVALGPIAGPNAVIGTRLDRYVRFVVSGVPRGGFSGGPVVHERGVVLGMIIQSLERRTASEGGFFTELSSEALRELLEAHGLLDRCQSIDP